MVKATYSSSLMIPAIVLLTTLLSGLTAAFPAGAQEKIADNCTLSRGVKIFIFVPGGGGTDNNDIVSIYAKSFVASSASAMNGLWGAPETDATRIRVTTKNEAGVLSDAGANNLGPTAPSVSMSQKQLSAVAGKWGSICLINTINTITDWAFFILLTISFVFVVVAGFLWVASSGDSEKQKAAGKIIFAALVGIVIAVIARMVPAVVTGILI